MFKKKDPNSFTRYIALFLGTPDTTIGSNNQIGYLVADYQAVNYDDVQARDAGSWDRSEAKQYILHCTQRIVLFNASMQGLPVFSPGTFPYENYPALLKTFLSVSLSDTTEGSSVQVLDYSPKTLNTKVQSSGSTGTAQGSSQGSSSSTTVGSSTAQTNSYGTSVSLGGSDMGDFFSVSGSVTESTDSSFTSSTDQSSSQGSSSSTNRSNDASESSSMSLKDWGTYAFVNPLLQNPAWVFGQEYPWDAISCRTSTAAQNPNNDQQVQLVLPQEMITRLYDPETQCLNPPSQLSMFGLNFVMKAAWLVSIPCGASFNTGVSISHKVDYTSASHLVSGGLPVVYVDQTPTALQSLDSLDTSLDLAIMGLATLGQPQKPAIVGFAANKFEILPSANPFRIISSANTLLVEDSTSYNPYPATPPFSLADNTLTATFSPQASSPLSVSAYFKVVDTVHDYKLYLKHWISTAMGVVLTITVNGDTGNTITKYVTAAEAEGGESNLLSISLRNQDFSSIDYHDYLQLGLNCVEISIAPNGTVSDTCVYQIRAMSVEKV